MEMVSGYSRISRELAEFLHRERRRVVPFVGAGVSVSAGVPAADDIAALIARRAGEEGADVPEDATFTEVCASVTEQLGHPKLQELAAELINGLDIEPTPLQQLIVRAPVGVVVTTNFDRALELAARSAGLTPLMRTPREARALEIPQDGEVVIVHLHGHVGDPTGMAMPGQSMSALATDEAFKAVLRGLVMQRAVVYLGYRLPPDDTYLHAEIQTLAEMFSDRGPHRLLLPLREYEARRAEFEALELYGVAVDTFDSDRSFHAVDQAGLLIAPGSAVDGEEALAPVRDSAGYYLPPTLLPEVRDRDLTEPDNRLLMAQSGLGDDSTRSPSDLLAARRAAVIAEPGMGKTQLLYHLGSLEHERIPLVLRLSELVRELEPDDDPERVLAAALSRSHAFGDDVRRPTRDALDRNAYALLFDALDEVGADGRAEAVALLATLADRYPQHTMIVTSRVNDDVFALESAGFEIFRIPRDGDWGRRYLEHRGIPDARVHDLLQEVRTIADLLEVPQYAALIGDRLAAEPLEAIPPTGFELMTQVAVGDAVRRHAESLGYSVEQLYGWLRLLAVSLELRGLLVAPADELAEIPGPNELRTPEARERLVERALLRDVPDVAALPTNPVQEALAADALLAMDDPLEAFLEAATTTLAGQPIFRDDVDHMIDLFFEGADPELRPSLRELDPLRWARTARADASREELGEALDLLWELYLERRVWVDSNRGREVRDARSAVTRLIKAIGDVGDERRSRWREATEAEEPTARANASFFLRQLGFDQQSGDWLTPLFADENSVVRREAAAAAVDFGEAGRDAFLPALRAAYKEERDELAAEAIGMTTFELTPKEGRREAAEFLATNHVGWNRINWLARELPLDNALVLFAATGLRSESDERHLAEIAANVPLEQWTDEQVQALVELVLRSHRLAYREFRERELLEELARTHPDAAIAGARAAARDDVSWNDLSFLQRIPADQIQAAANGPLEAPLTTLLGILERRAAQADEPPPPTPGRPPAPEPPTLAEVLDDGTLAARARARIPEPLLENYTREVADLDPDRRERLAAVVAELWPEGPLRDAAVVEGNSGRAPAGFDVALAFSTALDLPLASESWLELFESRAVFFYWGATEWLRAQSEGVDEARVIAAFESFENEFAVRQALNSLGSISDVVADAAATALIRINAIDSVFMLRDFRERKQLDALRRIQAEATAPEIRRAAQRGLAEAGDLEAQRAELAQMQQELAANPHAYSDGGFSWAQAARPDLIDELAAILRQIAVAGAGDRGGLDRSLQIALAATGDERAIEAYDAIIDDPAVKAGAFYRYQRDELARQRSREAALARLPARLRDVAQWAIDRGLSI